MLRMLRSPACVPAFPTLRSLACVPAACNRAKVALLGSCGSLRRTRMSHALSKAPIQPRNCKHTLLSRNALHRPYRGTSFIKNDNPIGPLRRPLPRVLDIGLRGTLVAYDSPQGCCVHTQTTPQSRGFAFGASMWLSSTGLPRP
jgi:hypothetical protein